MPRYIAFLRAINVGGHTVKMDLLRKLFESLRFSGVETFIASGNVVFESRSGDTRTMTRKVEARLHQALGYEVATFIRTDVEVTRIAAYEAFDAAEARSAKGLYVGFLASPVGSKERTAVTKLATATDDLLVHGREVYWLAGTRMSESDLSYAVIEKALQAQATFRGLNTVERLAARYPPSP